MLDAIRDPENSVHVSSVTLWELSLKHALGKLELHVVIPAEIPAQAVKSGFELLPVS